MAYSNAYDNTILLSSAKPAVEPLNNAAVSGRWAAASSRSEKLFANIIEYITEIKVYVLCIYLVFNRGGLYCTVYCTLRCLYCYVVRL